MLGWIRVAAAIGILTFSPAYAGFRDDQFTCLAARGTPDATIQACRSAIAMAERNPDLLNERNRADLWFQISQSYAQKNDRINAIGALDSAIATYSGDIRAPYFRARHFQALGQWTKAIADHDRAIQLLTSPRPGYSTDTNMLYQSYVDRGGCWEKLGDIKRATDNYDLALATIPGGYLALTARNRLAAATPTISAPTASQPAARSASAPGIPQPATQHAAPLKRAALIIGNSQYLYTNNLPNAVNDAKDVAEALKARGYAIYGYPRVNMHREDMFAAFDEFAKAAASADVALVWYAGHGQQMSDPGEPARNWLFPVDFKGGTDLDRGAVPLTKLLGAAQPAKKLRVVVVDACRNTTLQSGARNARGLRPEPRSDMVIVYSTAAGAIAEDGDPAERNSPFASAFLEVFKAHGNLDVRQFFGGVSEGVRRRTQTYPTPQQPELMSNLNTMETLPLAP
jgi:tetratricopeptide (TPR) repeat protein